MLNITAFSLPRQSLEHVNSDDGNEFKFIVNDKEYYCSCTAAEALSPLVKNLRTKDPTLNSLDLKIHDKRRQFAVLFNLIKGNQIILSKANAQIFIEFAKALNNTDLLRSAQIASATDVDPNDFIDYIIEHKEKEINIVYDLQRIAEHFDKFFACQSFSKLALNDIKALYKMDGISNIAKRLLKDKIYQMEKKPRNIDDFFLNPKQKKQIVVVNDGTNDFQGIIYMLSKNIRGNPILTHNLVIESNNNSTLHNLDAFVECKVKDSIVFQDFIQYDFKERKIKLSAYIIRVGAKTANGEVPSKFVLLGSNNLHQWQCIDEKVTLDGNFIYPFGTYKSFVQNDDYFRFLKLLLLENFSTNTKRNSYMQINSIEFFGTLMEN